MNPETLEKAKAQHIYGNFSEKEINEAYLKTCFGRDDIHYITNNENIISTLDPVIRN